MTGSRMKDDLKKGFSKQTMFYQSCLEKSPCLKAKQVLHLELIFMVFAFEVAQNIKSCTVYIKLKVSLRFTGVLLQQGTNGHDRKQKSDSVWIV